MESAARPPRRLKDTLTLDDLMNPEFSVVGGDLDCPLQLISPNTLDSKPDACTSPIADKSRGGMATIKANYPTTTFPVEEDELVAPLPSFNKRKADPRRQSTAIFSLFEATMSEHSGLLDDSEIAVGDEDILIPLAKSSNALAANGINNLWVDPDTDDAMMIGELPEPSVEEMQTAAVAEAAAAAASKSLSATFPAATMSMRDSIAMFKGFNLACDSSPGLLRLDEDGEEEEEAVDGYDDDDVFGLKNSIEVERIAVKKAELCTTKQQQEQQQQKKKPEMRKPSRLKPPSSTTSYFSHTTTTQTGVPTAAPTKQTAKVVVGRGAAVTVARKAEEVGGKPAAAATTRMVAAEQEKKTTLTLQKNLGSGRFNPAPEASYKKVTAAMRPTPPKGGATVPVPIAQQTTKKVTQKKQSAGADHVPEAAEAAVRSRLAAKTQTSSSGGAQLAKAPQSSSSRGTTAAADMENKLASRTTTTAAAKALPQVKQSPLNVTAAPEKAQAASSQQQETTATNQSSCSSYSLQKSLPLKKKQLKQPSQLPRSRLPAPRPLAAAAVVVEKERPAPLTPAPEINNSREDDSPGTAHMRWLEENPELAFGGGSKIANSPGENQEVSWKERKI